MYVNPTTGAVSQTDPNTSTGSAAGSASSQKGSTVSQQEFLLLLITQIKNQDPLNPQDPSEFTSQLAQMSSLEQLINLNSGMSAITAQQQMNSTYAAASFIGKDATVVSNALQVKNGTPSEIVFETVQNAKSAKLEIYDAQGNLIRTQDLGELQAGMHEFSWDGKTESGASVSDGLYQYKLSAKTAANTDLSYQPLYTGQISAVYIENNTPMVEVGGVSYPLSNVVSFRQAAA